MSELLAFFQVEPLRVCESRHLCSPLQRMKSVPDMSRAMRTRVWAEGNAGSNELDLQQSLACSPEALRLLAQESSAPSLVMREIGGSGGLDVAAFFGPERLLLVDCKNSDPATPKGLRSQRAQANRLSLSALENITPLPSEITLVLLAGWSQYQDLPDHEHLGGWRTAASTAGWSRVPAGERWSVLPFKLEGEPASRCVIGRWDALAACEWASRLARSAPKDDESTRLGGHTEDVGYPLGISLKHHHQSSLYSLRIPADEYRMATGPAAEHSLVRSLLDAAYRGDLEGPGIRFMGEINEKGNVHLCFEGDSEVVPLRIKAFLAPTATLD